MVYKSLCAEASEASTLLHMIANAELSTKVSPKVLMLTDARAVEQRQPLHILARTNLSRFVGLATKQQPKPNETTSNASFTSNQKYNNQKSKRTAVEICRNWNNGNCKRTPCTYAHHCQRCFKPGHTKKNCPRNNETNKNT